MVSDSLNPYNRSDEDSCGDATGIKFEPSTNQVKDLILAVSEDYSAFFIFAIALRSKSQFVIVLSSIWAKGL